MNTFQHAKFEVGLYLAISKITWTLRGLILKTTFMKMGLWSFQQMFYKFLKEEGAI